MALRVGVLVSGEGSNLQALLDTVHGRDGIEIVAVGASRGEARGLERARAAGVEAATFARAEYGDREAGGDREARDVALGDWLDARDVELVVTAGFMEILSAAFIRRFDGRIVNVHPSLLPAFPGLRAIEQALDYGVRVAGVTVHFLDEGVDSGPVILQESFELPYARDLTVIEASVHEIEHRLLPRAVRLIAAGRLLSDPDNPRVVRLADEPDG